MAYTVTKLYQYNEGNKVMTAFDVTTDAASGVIVTPLSVVEAVAICPVSMGTAGIKVKRNLNAASATANGSIMVSSAASGDVFTVIAVGH